MIAADTLRRAVLFLIATGAPVCVGVLLGQPSGALLGCVCGLLFSFADDDGPLSKRLTILGMVAGAIALGGATGIVLRGFPPPLWLLFAALTFATGILVGVGKAPSMAARLAAMALVVTASAPTFELAEVFYPAGVLVLVAVLRAIDQRVAGPVSQQQARPRTASPGRSLRFALAYAATGTASLWIGLAIDPARVLWVVVTTLLVMQPDARASYVRIVQRTTGTVLGVIAAFAVTQVVHAPWLIAVCILLVAPFVPHHLPDRYWLHTALIALLILLAYDLGTFDPRVLHGLFTERLQDVLLGAGLALIGTAVAFPRKPPAEADA